ncbi:MAG TPA: glycosyltransferase [Alteromonas sp.]|nr:glycosyltransferase [Alteromonas sp.]|tara:strand:- start:14337 stop:15488 length:1152 start_codon:yes stop_codon:yes gene_type:complete
MKVILFVINSIGYGGAERALVNILRHPPDSKTKIHVLLLDDEPLARELPEHVTVHFRNSKKKLLASIINVLRVQQTVRPDVSVSFLVRANVSNIIAGLIGRYCPVVICERMHLDSHLDNQFTGLKRAIAKAIPKLFYRFTDKALGVSTGVTKNLLDSFNLPRHKAHTIFNPYDLQLISEQGTCEPEFPLPADFIISVGRLTPAKNMQLLIEAYLESNETASLCILGTGEIKEQLEAYIKQRKADDRVKLLGYAQNPFAIVAKAKYFISASTNEGFPNALLEAMALGRPCIMSNCPSGPSEIMAEESDYYTSEMTPEKFGVLVPLNNKLELARAMNYFQSTDKRERYSFLAEKRSKNFAIETITKEYWDFFMQVSEAGSVNDDY